MLAENLRYRLDERLQTLSRQFIVLRNAREVDIPKLEATRTQLLRLTKARGVSLEKRLRVAENEWLGQAPYSYARSIAEENATDAHDEKLLAFLNAKLKYTVARWQAMSKKSPKMYSKPDMTAEQFIADAEYNLYNYSYNRKSTYPQVLSRAVSLLTVEKTLTQPDAAAVARYEAEIEKIKATISPLGQEKLQCRFSREVNLWDLRFVLIEELRKDAPNEKRVAEIEAQFIALQGEDYSVQARKTGSYTRLPPVKDLKEYGRQRAARIRARIEGEKIEAKLKAQAVSISPKEAEVLKAQRAKLAAREKELMVRIGDPLIRVFAPRDALRVVAILPGGEIKNLRFDEESREWQARFDVPTHSEETQYLMQLVTVLKNGNRLYQKFSYRVDLTAPTKGVLRATSENAILDLEITTEKNVARVEAILPWNERVSLARGEAENQFQIKVSVPPNYANKKISVTLVLTDRAHNRTMVETEVQAN